MLSKLIVFVKKEKVLLILVLLLALILRLYVLICYPSLINLSHDAKRYDFMARQLNETGVYSYGGLGEVGGTPTPNAYVTPGYPLFLVLIYKLVGMEYRLVAVRFIQALLSVATVGLFFLIAKRIKDYKVGLVTALLMAVYPTFILAPETILTEVLSVFFLALYIYLQMLAFGKNNYFLYFITGLVFAASVLVRPALFPILFIPFVYNFWKTRDIHLLKFFLVTFTGFALLMLPWTIRNMIVIGQPALFSTHIGDPLLGGVDPYFSKNIYEVTQGDKFNAGVRTILKGFLNEPLLYLRWFLFGKFAILFYRQWIVVSPRSIYADEFQFIMNISHYLIVILGWLGVILSIRRPSLRLISLLILCITAIYLIFIPEPRFAFASMHLLCIPAAYIVVDLFSRKESVQKD